MSIKEIFCQDKAIGILQKAFTADKMPHAYIFAGPEGVGKFKTAAQWAKLLLCENPVIESGFADSCGDCNCCRQFDAGSHADFHHIYKELVQFTREGKNKKTPVMLPIDVVREFLLEKIQVRPTLSKRKVFVISEAEKLNAPAQNCLLKALEEPPLFVTIIMLCTRADKLLATTKSRCRMIRFGAVDAQTITEQLEREGLDRQIALSFAAQSCGSLGMACSWAKLEMAGAGMYRIKTNIVDSISNYQYPDSLEVAEKLQKHSKTIADEWFKLEPETSKTDINRRAAKTVIQMIISALHDAMKLNIDPEKHIINFDQKPQINNLARRMDAETLAEKIQNTSHATQWIDSSVNEKLIFERILLNLAVSDTMTVSK
jgi:DNA polymerase-3 subunit delta'